MFCDKSLPNIVGHKLGGIQILAWHSIDQSTGSSLPLTAATADFAGAVDVLVLYRDPKYHINIRILHTMVSGIRLILGLRTRM